MLPPMRAGTCSAQDESASIPVKYQQFSGDQSNL
jgi:hypothetical protein